MPTHYVWTCLCIDKSLLQIRNSCSQRLQRSIIHCNGILPISYFYSLINSQFPLNLHQIVQSRREQLLQKKHKLEKLLSKAPEGSLIYSKTVIRNRSYFKWYSSTPSGRHYISRHNRNLARELARKKLRQQQLKDVEGI